jgi:hypothetical protein
VVVVSDEVEFINAVVGWLDTQHDPRLVRHPAGDVTVVDVNECCEDFRRWLDMQAVN